MGKDDNDNLPSETMSPLAMAAMQMHEMYHELRKAGFTRQEALYIVVKMSTGSVDG